MNKLLVMTYSVRSEVDDVWKTSHPGFLGVEGDASRTKPRFKMIHHRVVV
jgi:hypothetical protein